VRQPLREPGFGTAQVAVGDADLLETERLAPPPDVGGERGQIKRLILTILHKPDHKLRIARFLATEAETLALGAALSEDLPAALVIYLIGDLGAGKTTLARGILRGLGFEGRVKSPTYTLVEVYKFSRLYLYHFDFYRFDDPEELADSGFREYFDGSGVCLVEWPAKAAGLPAADISIELAPTDGGRSVELIANTEVGRRCLERLEDSSTT